MTPPEFQEPFLLETEDCSFVACQDGGFVAKCGCLTRYFKGLCYNRGTMSERMRGPERGVNRKSPERERGEQTGTRPTGRAERQQPRIIQLDRVARKDELLKIDTLYLEGIY